MKQWLIRRGLVAALPVVGLAALALDACSSSESGPGASERPHVSSKTPQVDGVELEVSPVAVQRLARLSQQFTRMPRQPSRAPAPTFPAGIVPPKPAPALEPIPARAVLSKGAASGFLRQGERFRAQVEPHLKENTLRPATVDLPATADGFVRVQPDESKIGVEFATKHARGKAEIEVADGTASYANGAPEGGDLVFRVTADAVEDYVVLDRKPATPRIEYTVNVGEVAGLRLYDNTLEFLNGKGDPQIRVKPPRVVDADGVIYEAEVSLSGCKFDTTAQPPWDRPVTAPGASECTMAVSWDDTHVVYPAIVDPVWATAGSLATARYRAGAVRMSDGKALTCGGISDIGIAIKSCEV